MQLALAGNPAARRMMADLAAGLSPQQGALALAHNLRAPAVALRAFAQDQDLLVLEALLNRGDLSQKMETA